MNQRIELEPTTGPPSGGRRGSYPGWLPEGQIYGNFACARMEQDLVREGDSLHITGDLGPHKMETWLRPDSQGGLIHEGDLGDLHFRQIFTRV